jgi:hypothetical protein
MALMRDSIRSIWNLFAKLEGKKIDTGSTTLPHDESTSGAASIASQPQFGMPLNFVDGQ